MSDPSGPSRPSRGLPWGTLALVVVVSLLARQLLNTKVPDPERGGWTCSDPDSLYHMRRVERVFTEGLPVAGTDPFMNYPGGARIPWPPGYTLIVSAILAPFAPDDAAALKVWIEQGTASLPYVWGVLTSLLAALAGWWLAGRTGALVAGLHHALSMASIGYSRLGNGDHHAFVALVSGALLALLTRALRGDVLATGRRTVLFAAGAGLLAGVGVVTWVGSLTYVLGVDLVLAVLLLVHARGALPGLPAFGFVFHVAALVVVLPGVLSSPWLEVSPWDLRTLTWMQPLALATGALVFVPVLLARGRGFLPRHYPWVLPVALGALAAVLVAVDVAPVAALREAAAVVDRADGFTTNISESRPLVGPDARLSDFVYAFGLGAPLLPLALWAMAVTCVRRKQWSLVPWLVAVPYLGLFAVKQYRLADAFSLPMAVVLGWGAAWLLQREGVGRVSAWAAALRRRPRWQLGALGILVVGLVQFPGSSAVVERALAPADADSANDARQQSARALWEWVRDNTPMPPDYSVLTTWGRGHAVEWIAERPSVATNFGDWVGEESYRTPSRFLLSRDPAEAEALLEARRARYVMVTGEIMGKIASLVKALGPEAEGRFGQRLPQGGFAVTRAWYETMSARIAYAMRPFKVPAGRPLPPLDFLRVVHMTPPLDVGPLRGGSSSWVLEHVPGAWVEAEAPPGTQLSVRVTVEYAPAGTSLDHSDVVLADTDGRARLRVPYATTAPNGDGLATGPLEWTLGERTGTLEIGEDDVLLGRTLRLPDAP